MTVPNDRIAIPPAQPGKTALYRFLDDEDRLLYVGITDNPKNRWAAHRRYAATTWWPLAARAVVVWHETREVAAAAELHAIRTNAPLYNSGGAPSPRRKRVPGEKLCPQTNIGRFYEATGGGFQLSGRPWRNMDVAVAETLAADIESGRLKGGDPMPSATQLVNRFGVSVHTVRRALRKMVDTGQIETRGAGTRTRYFASSKQSASKEHQQ